MSTPYLIVITILGWGIGSLFYKVANDNIHPIMVSTVVTAVYLIITPMTYIFFKFPKDLNTPGISASVLAGLCMAGGSLAYFFALRRGSAGEVTTITALYPGLTLLLSMYFLKETINLKQGIGMAFALISFVLLGMK